MTPGPWKWFDYPDGRKLLSGLNHAVIHCPDAPMTIDEDDARLIAAAPEMLAACRAVQSSPHYGNEVSEEAMAMVDAAIAKVEGR